MSIQDNANWAVRKMAAAWAATRAERPVWAGSVLSIDEAIENAEADLQDRSIFDPFFFLMSKATGKNSRLIVATEIVVNQIQAHPGWFTNIGYDEKYGDLNPDKLAEAHLAKEKEKRECEATKSKEKKNSQVSSSSSDQQPQHQPQQAQ